MFLHVGVSVARTAVASKRTRVVVPPVPGPPTGLGEPPMLALTGSPTAYPPTVSIALPFGVASEGDALRIQATAAPDIDDPDFTSPVVNVTRALTANAAADIAAINGALAGIAASAHFLRASLNDGTWSPWLLHGTAAAPALVSGAFNQLSSVAMTHTLSLTMPGTPYLHGEDSELLEIIPLKPDGTMASPAERHLYVPATHFRLRWINNGVRPYAATDFDGDFIFEPKLDVKGANGVWAYNLALAVTLEQADDVPEATAWADITAAVFGQSYNSGAWEIEDVAPALTFQGSFTRAGEGTYTKNGVSGLTDPSPTYALGDVFSIDGEGTAAGAPGGGSFNFGGVVASFRALPDAVQEGAAFAAVENAPISSTGSSNQITFNAIGAGYSFSSAVTLPEGWTYTHNGVAGLTADTLMIERNDTFSFQYEAPDAGAQVALGSLTVAETTYPFSVETAVGNPPFASEAVLFLDWTDAATRKQLINGTTDANTLADPVGYWGDKSASGFHMTAPANDATRPTLGADGIVFTTTQYLRRIFGSAATSINLYQKAAAAGVSVIVMGKFNAAASHGVLVAEGSGASTNPIIAFGRTTSGNNTNIFLRNDANSQKISTASTMSGAGHVAFDGNPCCLIYEVDARTTDANASNGRCRDDNVQGTGTNFTRDGVLTVDRLALNCMLRTTAASFASGTYQLVLVIPRLLSVDEKAQIVAWAEAYQQREI